MRQVEWRELRNGEPFFMRAMQAGDTWSFEERSSFDVQYFRIPPTLGLVRRAELEVALSDPQWGRCCRAGLEIVRESVIATEEAVRRDAARALEPAHIGTKPIRAIDLTAEWDVVRSLRLKLGQQDFVIYGEECLRDENCDLAGERRPVFLVDALDGTDLLARGLSNWCSAMALYDPPARRIVASFIGLPGGVVYYVIGEETGKYCYSGGTVQVSKLTGASGVTSIRSASLAFYGQKVANFLAVVGIGGFSDYLAQLQDEGAQTEKGLDTRIYNLAGNPAFTWLVDGLCRIDAVFEVRGQALHDMIPGARIAQKCGAFVCDLEGEPLDLDEMVARSPRSRVRYVAAATKALALELCQKLSRGSEILTLREPALPTSRELCAAP